MTRRGAVGRWRAGLAAACWAVCLLVARPASAWFAAGHMIVARIAFDQLPPDARQQIMAILAAHPQMGEWRKHLDFAPVGERDAFLFMSASTWPDEINRAPNPYAHPAWHYIDYPLTPPDFAFQAGLAPDNNALFAITQSTKTLRDPAAGDEARAASLSWLIHLVGDLHHPLHCAEFVTPQYPPPTGDRGGNLFFVAVGGQPVNLHAFWDALPGSAKHPDEVFAQAADLEKRFPAASLPELATAADATAWSLEGRAVAIDKVYLWGTLPGSSDPHAVPPPLPDGYVAQSKAVADRRLALAGYRLAVLLRGALTPSGQAVPTVVK